jgi:MFS family permease
MSSKFRLGAMMFLQYAIWGAWFPVLSDYLMNNLGFNGNQVGAIYSLLPLATIISLFVGGQVTDRYFPAQFVIAVLQFIGGILLIIISQITTYSTMIWLMLFYFIIYAPTLALTNSIAFINLKNSEKEFGVIRVWGTIGWIVAGLALAGWRLITKSSQSFAM